jgi:hypothetical protein
MYVRTFREYFCSKVTTTDETEVGTEGDDI